MSTGDPINAYHRTYVEFDNLLTDVTINRQQITKCFWIYDNSPHGSSACTSSPELLISGVYGDELVGAISTISALPFEYMERSIDLGNLLVA